MRRVIFSAACTLDGYIAGVRGEVDWIRMDADYGMGEMFARVDTALIGRKTFDFARASGMKFFGTMKNYVFSRTLAAGKQDEVEVVGGDAVGFVRELKAGAGKDIWLMGGHDLARGLIEARLVDEMEFAVHPVLLGGGVPVFGAMGVRTEMELVKAKEFKNGVVLMKYRLAG